jgi:hypothetical protein
MTQAPPRQAQQAPHLPEGDQEATYAAERLLGVAMAAQSSKLSCPTDIRARAGDASTSDAAWWRSTLRCGASRADGTPCNQRVRRAGDVCCKHNAARDLPDELVVLRDPATGDPMEVG